MDRITGTEYTPNSRDRVLFYDLPVGAQFEYHGEPYIKIAPEENNGAFCYTFGKVMFFNCPIKVIRKTFDITIT